MILCGICKGQGILQNQTPFSLPVMCPRCQGAGHLLMKDLRFGDHAILLYTGVNEQIAASIEFIKMGLTQNELGVFVAQAGLCQTFKAALAKSGVDVKKESERGSLLILTEDKFYLTDGRFVPEDTVRKIETLERTATAGGFSAVRGIGELSWALGDPGLTDKVVRYENLLDEYFRTKRPRIVVLCQYDQMRFSVQSLKPLMQCHGPMAIV